MVKKKPLLVLSPSGKLHNFAAKNQIAWKQSLDGANIEVARKIVMTILYVYFKIRVEQNIIFCCLACNTYLIEHETFKTLSLCTFYFFLWKKYKRMSRCFIFYSHTKLSFFTLSLQIFYLHLHKEPFIFCTTQNLAKK